MVHGFPNQANKCLKYRWRCSGHCSTGLEENNYLGLLQPQLKMVKTVRCSSPCLQKLGTRQNAKLKDKSDQRKTEGACHGKDKDGGKNLNKERGKGYITLQMASFIKLLFQTHTEITSGNRESKYNCIHNYLCSLYNLLLCVTSEMIAMNVFL